MNDDRPVLFVTNHAPAFRVGAFAALHARANVHFALVGGRLRHGGALAVGAAAAGFPILHSSQRNVFRIAASGRYRAVVAGLSGRVALPAAYLGARAARVPFVLWASIWRHPRTPGHALSYLPLRQLYRHADAVVTYGPHVSAYVRAKAPDQRIFVAPQSVDNAFWSAPAPAPRRHAPFQVLFAGRLEEEKGVASLLAADRGDAALILAGAGPLADAARARGAICPGPLDRAQLRNFYAGSDVVVMPSLPTPAFLEPWGLVANEAFNQGVPVIATTAVGAAAGGLVRHEQTGLLVPPGDPGALGAAIARLRADPELRARLGVAARTAVTTGYSHQDWAAGIERALAGCGRPAGDHRDC